MRKGEAVKKLIGMFATALLCIALGILLEWGREVGISLSML